MAKRANTTTITNRPDITPEVNANFEAVNEALENTLSLDGSTPNAMGADLDMNSNDILNTGDIYTDNLHLQGVDITAQVTDTATKAAEAAASAASASASEVSASSDATASAASAAASEVSAGESDAYARESETARDQAVFASEASGDVVFYDTKALADAAVGGLPENQIVEVFSDEDEGGLRTRYRVESGVLAGPKVIFGEVRHWFVDATGGSDSNNGRTPDTAFATLATLAAAMADGDKAYLKRGEKWREQGDFSALNGCVFDAYGGGARPILSAWDVVSSFSIYGSGPAYTFTVNVEAVAANRGYAAAFEDGVRMREVKIGDTGIANEAAAIAHVEANPGWFYFAGPGSTSAGWSSGVKTYYIHASDGGNPSSNGKEYEVYSREYATELGNDCEWRNVVFQMGYGHNGLTEGDGQKGRSTLKNTAAIYAGQHSSLFDEATFENHDVIGALGTGFHSNPEGSVFDLTTLKGCRVIGDERGTFDGGLSSQAFYTHGNFDNSTIQKEGWLLEDVHVENVQTLFSHPDCRTVRVKNGFFRNFGRIAPQSTNGNVSEEFTLEDCEFWHTERGELTDRIFYCGDACTATFRRSYMEFFAQYFTAALSGEDVGNIVLEDVTLVMRAPFNVADAAVFRHEGSGLDKITSITLQDTTIYYADYPQGYLVNAQNLDSISVDQLLIIGPCSLDHEIERDPKLRIGGSDVLLSSLDADARVVTIDASRAVLDDRPGQKITLKRGVWQPGDPILSGAAYSEDGATQPRTHVFVGDKIWRGSGSFTNTNITVTEASPSDHLNAVHFCNSGATDRSYVIVGDGGAVYSTDINGSNPTARTSGVTDNLHAVWGHTDGVVIAVGDDGTVIKSTDSGDTWSEIVSGTSEHLYGVATDGTTWVAVGANGTVGTSTDSGATWTWGTQGSNDYRAAIWSNEISLFLIGGDEGEIRTSPATIAWTSRTSNTNQQVRCFAEVDGGIIAGLYQTKLNYTSSFIVTADGAAWEFSPTVLPYEVRAIAGPGTSLYQQRGVVAVGESAFGAMVESPIKGEPWKVQRLFGGDGHRPDKTTAAQEIASLL